MKFLIAVSTLLFLGVSSSNVNAPAKNGDYLNWKDGELEWKDFKGKAPSNTPYAALTYSAIDLQIEGLGDKLSVHINTIFDPKQSWKKDNITDFLLKHEQLHFDITEYHSRLLREKIQTLKFESFESIGPDIQKEFNTISQAADEMQETYDYETDHSKVKEEQLNWNKKLKELLDSKSDYTETDLTIDISYLH